MTPETQDWERFYKEFRKPGFIPGYEITTKLGGGSFGVVYKATKQSIAKDYAVKFLRVDDVALRAAIMTELDSVRWLAQVDHPNLVSIEDKGEVDSIPYLIMAYAGSETLRTRLTQDGSDIASLLPLVIQACLGVQALHERSLVHFDIKPENIFLKGDVAKVGDYGLSKMVTASRKTLSMARGTPYYMAPEVAHHCGDHRSDIYSLGVVLYECCTGTVPFAGSSDTEVIAAHESKPVHYPPTLPTHIRAVLGRMLAKEPESRISSLGEVLTHLQQPRHLSLPLASTPHQAAASRATTSPTPVCSTLSTAVLEDALRFLSDSQGLSRHNLVPAEALAELRRRLESLQALRDDLPRVVICGEFKAGKSTLVNALVGQEVAAMDVREMTPCVSVIHPGAALTCRVTTLQGGDVTLPIADFLAACKSRSTHSQFPHGIAQVSIAADSSLPFVLVDTPGTGSTTLDNELQQVAALESADLLLWTIDLNSLGALRDFVVVEEAQRLGMPIWVALNQCDTADSPAVVEAALAWIATTHRIPRRCIFPCAALPALEAHLNGFPEPPNAGVRNLRAELATLVARRGAALRKEAREAAERRIAVDLARLLGSFAAEVERHELSLRRLDTELQAIGVEVFRAVEQVLCNAVDADYLEPYTAPLAEYLERKGVQSRGPSEKHAVAALHATIPEDYPTKFWHQRVAQATALMADRWRTLMADAQTRMVKAFELERSVLLPTMGSTVQSGVLAHIVEESAATQFEERTQSGLAIAGLATAYTAWLGPSAASISLGAALSGVGIPLALLGVGVAWVLSRGTPAPSSNQPAAEQAATRLVHGLRTQFREAVLEPYLLPRFRETNSQVIEATLEAWCKSRHGGFEPAALRHAMQKATALLAGLTSATQGQHATSASDTRS